MGSLVDFECPGFGFAARVCYKSSVFKTVWVDAMNVLLALSQAIEVCEEDNPSSAGKRVLQIVSPEVTDGGPSWPAK